MFQITFENRALASNLHFKLLSLKPVMSNKKIFFKKCGYYSDITFSFQMEITKE